MKCICCNKKTKSNHHPFCTRKCEEKWRNQNVYQKIDDLLDYPSYNEPLTLNWSKWCCTADWHNPFLCKKVFKRMIKECVARKVTNLLIAGDFFDMNNFTKFFNLNKVSWVEEKMFSKGVLDILKVTFKDIAFIVANHELRYLKTLNRGGGDGDIYDIYHLIGFKKFENITVQHRCFVGDWVVLHPDTYRKTPLSYARERSTIYKDKNVVVTHAHMQAQSWDQSGKYYLIDLGCMADPDKIEYKNINETAHYAWNKGFMIVDKNVPTLYHFPIQ